MAVLNYIKQKIKENSDTLKNVNENLHVALNLLKLYVKIAPRITAFGGNWCNNERKRPARFAIPPNKHVMI